ECRGSALSAPRRRDPSRLRQSDRGRFLASRQFFSNYEPLTATVARDLLEDSIGFHECTEPMQKLIREVAETSTPNFFVCSAHPRLVDGKPSKNPRYLQIRPDLMQPRASYLAEMSTRLRRRLPPGKPIYNPVAA